VTIEEKVALENQVKNISREADYVVDRIDDISKENQKMLLLLLVRTRNCWNRTWLQ
jgi:tRNA A37 threonylcarbamoyladenosine dehydratase